MQNRLLFLMLLGFTLLFTSLPRNAAAFIIDFEEGLNNAAVIPDGYEGFNWDNFNALNNSTFNANVTPGGSFYGYLNLGPSDPEPFLGVTSVDPNQVFDFSSAWMSANWGDDLKVTVNGHLDGAVAYRNSITLDYRNPQRFIFDFDGIDYLSFTVDPLDQPNFSQMGNPYYAEQVYAFAMDDLDVTAPVPIPGTAFLFVPGLGLFAWLRRS